MLAGLALLVADGPAAAAPTLRQAVSVFTGAGLTVEDGLRWSWMAQGAVDLDQVREWRIQHGITSDILISLMGGSP